MSTDEDTRRRRALDERLWEFHGVDVPDVLETVDYLREPDDTVIAGGSLTFGLGNPLSDFDVVVCGPTTPPSRVPLEHWAKTLRVDAWTRAHADLDSLFQLAAQALERPDPIGGAFGSVEEEQQLKLLHRVAFGLRLAGAELAPVTSSERGISDIARDLVVREYAERLRESICVAQLAAHHGRPFAAALNARQAVEEAFNVVLAARGVPFTGDKWLHERLKTHAPDLRAAYRRFAALPDDRECAGYVAEAVELAASLTGLRTDPATLLAQASWVGSGLRVHPAAGKHLLVAADAGVVWELDDGDAATWRSLAATEDPAPSDEPAQVWPGERCGPTETSLCLGLYEGGLVKLVWDRGVPLSDLTVAPETTAKVSTS